MLMYEVSLNQGVAWYKDELAVARIDNPLRMICVCPTCHRILHYGNDASLASKQR